MERMGMFRLNRPHLKLLERATSRQRRTGYLSKQKIPMRLTEQDTSQVGYIEADLVLHCGSPNLGEYISTVNSTDVSSGWWEGEDIMVKSQKCSFWTLKGIRKTPVCMERDIDTDNDSGVISRLILL